MKYLYRMVLVLIILITLSCNISDNQEGNETSTLEYDSLLVEAIVHVTDNVQVAQLTGWDIDENESENKPDMLFLENLSNNGMMTIKVYNDANFSSYLQETLDTFDGIDMISESTFDYSNKTYHQYILNSEGFIVHKALIEIGENLYVDTNIIVIEEEYTEISYTFDTYLASIAIFN